MNQYQQLENIKLVTNTRFEYGRLSVIMHHRRDPSCFLSEHFEPIVEVRWCGSLLGSYPSLLVALTETFNAVRACRPDITGRVGSDRSTLLLSLSALGELVGVEINGFCETPEIETRMHPEDDRLSGAFPHWGDRPQVSVYAAVSSPDHHNYDNEGIRYRIRMTNSRTTFEHEEYMSSRSPINLKPLLADLMLKHFA